MAQPCPTVEELLSLIAEGLGAASARFLDIQQVFSFPDTAAPLADVHRQPSDGVFAQAVVHQFQTLVRPCTPDGPCQVSGQHTCCIGAPIQVQGRMVGALLLEFPCVAGEEGAESQINLAEVARTLVEAHLTQAGLNGDPQRPVPNAENFARLAVEAQEAEREWISIELHDRVTQNLVAAFQLLQTYDKLAVSRPEEARPLVGRAAAMVREAIREARELSNSITPAPLHELGLVATLRQEMKRLEEETGASIQFNAPRLRFPREIEIGLYRIAHEALINVKKHARSARVQVDLTYENGRIMMGVRDWGVGFDSALAKRSTVGHSTGLYSMQKRAEILKGTCTINTRPGQGTEVVVVVPCPSALEQPKE
ncbi:MAG: sensor histidine kinase [Chloroflexi bacterium]|nr:sensor histidine kinase [Chloroflexota bacterium]